MYIMKECMYMYMYLHCYLFLVALKRFGSFVEAWFNKIIVEFGCLCCMFRRINNSQKFKGFAKYDVIIKISVTEYRHLQTVLGYDLV